MKRRVLQTNEDTLTEFKEGLTVIKPSRRLGPPNQLKRILTLAEKPEPIPVAVVVYPTDKTPLKEQSMQLHPG